MRWQVWNAINSSEHLHTYGVSSPEEGARLIRVLAVEQLGMRYVEANAFGLQVYEPGGHAGWQEWYDDDGEDVHTLIEHLAFDGDEGRA